MKVGQTKCRDPGSNRGPSDLQSDALPTELSRQVQIITICLIPVRLQYSPHELTNAEPQLVRAMGLTLSGGPQKFQGDRKRRDFGFQLVFEFCSRDCGHDVNLLGAEVAKTHCA